MAGVYQTLTHAEPWTFWTGVFDSNEKDECVDINECESDCNRKGQECINTIGSYICNCQPGFRLDDFGKSEFTYAIDHLSRSPAVIRDEVTWCHVK